MLLSNRDIRSCIDSGRVHLEPWDPQMIQPSSIDIHPDRFLRLFNNHKCPAIDPATDQPELMRLVDVSAEGSLILYPGEFVLNSTYEKVTLADNVATRLEDKSSLGRLGLLTHSTAGFIDPGFSDHAVLELLNMATLPIVLYPRMKVGQLCFFQLSSVAEEPYDPGASGSRRQGQRGPAASHSYLNLHRISVGEMPAERSTSHDVPVHTII